MNDVLTPDAPVEEIPLKDELRSALAGLKERDAAAETVSHETVVESAEAKAARARDEAGRFAKAEAAKPRDTLTLPAPAVDPAQGLPVAQPLATAPKAPEGWSTALKAEFATLKPEVQAEITRRESEMHKAFTRQDEERSLGKQIKEASLPYMPIIQAEGGDPAKAFAMFLNYAYTMRQGTPQQKVAALHNIARTYNVELGTQLQPSPSIDPHLQTLQQRLDHIERERQAEIQQRQFQERSSLESEIKAFSAAPGHEHFEAVKSRMAVLLKSEQAKDLQDAYDQAVWSIPEIRSTLTAQLTGEAEQKRLTEAKAKTDAAKRAAGSITGGPGAASATAGAVPDRSLNEELRANLRAATGRI